VTVLHFAGFEGVEVEFLGGLERGGKYPETGRPVEEREGADR